MAELIGPFRINNRFELSDIDLRDAINVMCRALDNLDAIQ